MKNYINDAKLMFEKPTLNKVGSKRGAHPLELFFDLIFVASMAKIGHLMMNPTMDMIVVSLLLFLTVYQIWKNITLYIIYYFGATYIIKVFLFLSMLPVIYLIGIEDVNKTTVYYISILFAISRFILAYMWYIPYKSSGGDINDVGKQHMIKFIISGLVALIPLINVNYFLESLLIALVLEMIIGLFRIYVKKIQEYSIFDFDLLKERQMLFLIIVWGEGIILITNSLGDDFIFEKIIMSAILFLIIFIHFSRVVEEYELTSYNNKNIHFFNLSHAIFIYGNLTFFMSLGEIVFDESINTINKSIVIGFMLFLTTWYLYVNESIEKFDHENMHKYVAFDNKFLFSQYGIIILMIFVESKEIFIGFVLIYFILSLIASPYRYKALKIVRNDY